MTAQERAALVIRATRDEVEWVRHAANLRDLSVTEYVKEAVNRQLRREGVDAVLFALKSEAEL